MILDNKRKASDDSAPEASNKKIKRSESETPSSADSLQPAPAPIIPFPEKVSPARPILKLPLLALATGFSVTNSWLTMYKASSKGRKRWRN